MQMAQTFRHFTILQPDGDDKYFTIVKQLCLIEGDLQLFVAVARLPIESARQADEDPVAVEDRFADLMLPVLPGLQILRVQPGMDPIPNQALVKFADCFLIPVCVNQKDVHLLC